MGILDEIFLDQTSPAQPFDGLFSATIAANATSSQADVTLDGFDAKNAATYTCVFEPRVVGDSARTPPLGSKCLVAFTTPIAYVAGTANVGMRSIPWIVAFAVPAFAWPS
jgi:hypothetical protein